MLIYYNVVFAPGTGAGKPTDPQTGISASITLNVANITAPAVKTTGESTDWDISEAEQKG
jgi:hypothetical protein